MKTVTLTHLCLELWSLGAGSIFTAGASQFMHSPAVTKLAMKTTHKGVWIITVL